MTALRCPDCGHSFPALLNLKGHLCASSDLRLRYCRFCAFATTDPAELLHHEVAEHDPPPRRGPR